MGEGGIARTLLRSLVGKLGVALFIVLGIGAIFATFALPLDFGRQVWNNPTYWAAKLWRTNTEKQPIIAF